MVHGSWCVVRHGMCFGLSMAIARHHEQLDCWRLSEELRLGVEAILAKPLVSRDFGFCDQIRDSTSSAPANIAEGFARYRPKPFAQRLRDALGELGETQNHLQKALTKNYVNEEEFNRLWRLSRRAFGATTRLHEYLIKCGDNYPDYAHGDAPPFESSPRKRVEDEGPPRNNGSGAPPEPGTLNPESEPGTRNPEPGTRNQNREP